MRDWTELPRLHRKCVGPVGKARAWNAVVGFKPERILQMAEKVKLDLISVDVFDTLLLRSTKPEIFRFWQMADEVRSALSAAGYASHTQEDFFVARLLASRAAYRNAARRGDSEEAEINEIYRLILKILGLPAEAASTLHDAEIKYETMELAANRPLIEILRRVRSQGVRLVYASDMYLPTTSIDLLLEAAGVGGLFDGRYSSADTGLSKRSGALFSHIARREGIDPARCLHFGDSLLADVRRPAEQGWHSFHAPRTIAWRVAVEARRRMFTLGLYRRGLLV